MPSLWPWSLLLLSLSLGAARLQLKVVSYNVLYDTEDHLKNTHGALRFPALVRLLRASDADVYVLQEVRHNLLRLLKAEFGGPSGGGYHFSSDELSGGTETDARNAMLPGGLLTMSRAPPLSVRSVMRNPEATYKSFLVTTHALGDPRTQEPVEVANVHLEHRGGLTPCGSAKRSRTLQHAMATVQHASTAILAGDFNFGVPRAFKTQGQSEEQPADAWKPETSLVRRSAFVDVWPSLHPNHVGCTWSVEHNKMVTFLDDRGWGGECSAWGGKGRWGSTRRNVGGIQSRGGIDGGRERGGRPVDSFACALCFGFQHIDNPDTPTHTQTHVLPQYPFPAVSSPRRTTISPALPPTFAPTVTAYLCRLSPLLPPPLPPPLHRRAT